MVPEDWLYWPHRRACSAIKVSRYHPDGIHYPYFLSFSGCFYPKCIGEAGKQRLQSIMNQARSWDGISTLKHSIRHWHYNRRHRGPPSRLRTKHTRYDYSRMPQTHRIWNVSIISVSPNASFYTHDPKYLALEPEASASSCFICAVVPTQTDFPQTWPGTISSICLIWGGFDMMPAQRGALWECHWGVFRSNQDGGFWWITFSLLRLVVGLSICGQRLSGPHQLITGLGYVNWENRD